MLGRKQQNILKTVVRITPEIQSSFIRRSSKIIMRTKKKNYKTTEEYLKKKFYFEMQRLRRKDKKQAGICKMIHKTVN